MKIKIKITPFIKQPEFEMEFSGDDTLGEIDQRITDEVERRIGGRLKFDESLTWQEGPMVITEHDEPGFMFTPRIKRNRET